VGEKNKKLFGEEQWLNDLQIVQPRGQRHYAARNSSG